MAERPRLSPVVAGLPASTPFVGPEALERGRGARFRARVGANESAFGVSAAARRAVRAAVDQLSWYGDPENHDLRQALAAHHGVVPERVVVGGGIDDLLALCVRAFVGDGVAVMTGGSYATFVYHVAGHGGQVHTVPYAGYRTDLEALAHAAAVERAAAVYLANPDNPAGTFHPAPAVEKLAAALPVGCALLLDEAYAEFAPAAELIADKGLPANVVRLRTFSKAHGLAGARVGYSISAGEVAAALDRIRQQFGVNRVAQAAALASLGDSDFVAAVVAAVAGAREQVADIGRKAGLTPLPSSTNFVAFDAGSARRADALLAELQKRGVFVRKTHTPSADQWIRVTAGSDDDLAVLREELPAAVGSVDAGGAGPAG